MTSDRNSRSGDSNATSRRPSSSRQIEDDLRIAFAAGKQGRGRIDGFGIETENLPGRIDDHTDRAFADRHHNDLAALSSITGRHPQQCAQRHQRQQAVPQRHDAQHRGFRARQLGDMIRQRNDLPHAVKRQRIFLLAEIEAQQRDQSLRRRSAAGLVASGAGLRSASRKYRAEQTARSTDATDSAA